MTETVPLEGRNFNIKTGARGVHALSKQFVSTDNAKRHDSRSDANAVEDYRATGELQHSEKFAATNKNDVVLRTRQRVSSVQEMPTVFNRRSLHETSWRTEADGASSEENEKLVNEFEQWLETQKQKAQQSMQLPIDNELQKVLGQRRKTTDLSNTDVTAITEEVNELLYFNFYGNN